MDIIQLKQSTQFPNGFYHGDRPGTLQYKKTIDELVVINTEERNGVNYKDNHVFAEHSFENLCRLTPNTKNGRQNWKILLVMQATNGDEIWMKGALLNKDTNEVALMTTTNNKDYIENNGNRAIQSINPQWYIGHYRMIAPLFFWNELKNRLLY